MTSDTPVPTFAGRLRAPTSLYWRLLSTLIPLVLVGVSVILWSQHRVARRELLAAIDKEVKFLSLRAAGAADDLLRQRRNDLVTLSEVPLIANYYKNVDFQLHDEAEAYRRELETYLLDFALRAEVYPEILYLDAAGRAVARIRGGEARKAGEDLRRQPYFVGAKAAVRGGSWSSSFVDAPGIGSALYFSLPVHGPGGAFKGVLALVYDTEQFRQLLDHIELRQDASGFIRFAGGRYPPEPMDRPERRTLSAATPLRERPWEVVVETSIDEALRPLKEMERTAVVSALAGLALLILTIVLLVREITRPIARLADGARRLGRGEFDVRIPESGSGELATLSSAFNEAAERLEANRKRNEELQGQLIQAEKVAAAGLLISSVAHELSNPLAVVSGYAQLLRRHDWPAAVKGPIEQIHRHAVRCAKVVDNMLSFVRQSRGARKPTDVNEVVRASVDLLEYRFRTTDHVEVVLDLLPEPPPVTADFQQLSQVVVNLINNACDAMQGLDAQRRRLTLKTRLDGAWLSVDVADTGSGIPADVAARVFDPFVTTKERGKGTGLGLYVCRQIAEAHQGRLSFSTRPGEGSTFRLELPVAPAPESAPGVPQAAPAEPVPGKRILVVDDEPSVGEVIRETLVEDRDEVAVALGGREAIESLRRERFDLVISDIEMKQAKGYDVYAEVSSRPKEERIPVLFVTGNILHGAVLTFLRETKAPYMLKPFDTDVLRRTVRRLLAGEPLTGLQKD